LADFPLADEDGYLLMAIALKLLDFPRINILAMAKSLTEPELKQHNTNELLDTKS
jgi:hypothetical protein